MRQSKKLICILLSALMLMSALSGCAERELAEEKSFVLRACVCSPIASLDPAANADTAAESVFRALYENLLRWDENESGSPALVPGVAKEYRETVNHDGTVDYVFTLRSSARWSDGVRVKAKDFVYAWRRLVDPELGFRGHALLAAVQGYEEARETGDASKLAVKAEDDTTLRVTLAAPCAYFLGEACTAVATMPLRSDAAKKDPDWTSTISILCNGPYRVGVWAKQSYIQLRRNGDYYDSRTVGPDVVRFLFAANGEEARRLYDAGEARRLYDAGEADYIASPPEGTEGADTAPLCSSACVLYNHESEAFSNAHVRRAFDLALDRTAAAAAAGACMAPATGLVPPGVVNVSAEEGEDFRSAGGELCAADADGYSMRCLEAEGELRNGGFWGGVGFPVVTCLYVAGDEARTVASAAAAIWNERLNVPVVTEGVSRADFARRLADGAYDLAVELSGVRCGDAMEYLDAFAGAEDVLRYGSVPYDLLIGAAQSCSDLAARVAFLHDAEALLLEDAALTPLYFGGTSYLLREGLTGVRHDLRGSVYFTAVTRTDAAEA